MVSFDSLLFDNPETPPAIEVAPHPTESQAKHTSFQVIEPSASGSRACSSVSVHLGADAAEGSFIRHHKYFFKDGNVTFLVRDTLIFSHESCVNAMFIDETLCTSRLETRCTASTDISSRVTRYTSPRDSPCLTSVTTRLSLPSYL